MTQTFDKLAKTFQLMNIDDQQVINDLKFERKQLKRSIVYAMLSDAGRKPKGKGIKRKAQ